jgi:hypothetical protein
VTHEPFSEARARKRESLHPSGLAGCCTRRAVTMVPVHICGVPADREVIGRFAETPRAHGRRECLSGLRRVVLRDLQAGMVLTKRVGLSEWSVAGRWGT